MALVEDDGGLDGGILQSPHTKVKEFVPQVSDTDGVLRDAVLEKRITGKTIYWARRRVILTSQHLLFKNEGSDEIKDCIKLDDISQVFRANMHRNNNIVGLGSSTVDKKDVLDEAERLASRKPNKRTSSMSPNAHLDHGNVVDEVDFHNAFSVHLQKYGRMYHLRAASEDECDAWIDHITAQIKEAQRLAIEALGITPSKRTRNRLRAIYDSPLCQSIIAVILVANFGLNIYDAELQPEDHSQTRKALDHVDTAITVLFGVELLLQLFIYWFWDFFTDVWCLLDLIVVALSVVETVMIEMEIGDSVNTNFVRLLRIFRIVKIFSKLKALQRIIIAVSASFGPVLNTLMTFGIINSLYAVLGTKLFSDHLPDRFRTFSTTSFTLLQLATWDSWSGDVVRPLLAEGVSTWAVAFFVSYIILVSLIVMNVMVAVLLEGFMGALARHETKERNRRAAVEHHCVAGPMDGLLITLANFNSHSDLSAQIHLLFHLFDVDDSGSLSFDELKAGLEKLDIKPTIKISDEDFDAFTFGGMLCDAEGALDGVNFEWAMRWQLQVFAQRLVAERMQESVRSHDAVVIFALKLALSELFLLSSPGCPRASDKGERLPSFMASPRASGAPPTPREAATPDTAGGGAQEEGGRGGMAGLQAAVEGSREVASEALLVAQQSRDMLGKLLASCGGAPLISTGKRSLHGAVHGRGPVEVSGASLNHAGGESHAGSTEDLSLSDEGGRRSEEEQSGERLWGEAGPRPGSARRQRARAHGEHRHHHSTSRLLTGERRRAASAERLSHSSRAVLSAAAHPHASPSSHRRHRIALLRADSDTGIDAPAPLAPASAPHPSAPHSSPRKPSPSKHRSARHASEPPPPPHDPDPALHHQKPPSAQPPAALPAHPPHSTANGSPPAATRPSPPPEPVLPPLPVQDAPPVPFPAPYPPTPTMLPPPPPIDPPVLPMVPPPTPTDAPTLPPLMPAHADAPGGSKEAARRERGELGQGALIAVSQDAMPPIEMSNRSAAPQLHSPDDSDSSTTTPNFTPRSSWL